MKVEMDNFDGNHAIHRISEERPNEIIEEAESRGEKVEVIPGMGVFTRKAGDGRRRARVVCCGNHMEARAGGGSACEARGALVGHCCDVWVDYVSLRTGALSGMVS